MVIADILVSILTNYGIELANTHLFLQINYIKNKIIKNI